MSVTSSNLIQGPADLYTAAFGATEPLDSAVNAAPTTPWVNAGATDGGVKLVFNQSFSELSVDQIVDTPERRMTSREATIQTNLAEPTLANLVIALNGGTVTTGSGNSTYDPVSSSAAIAPTYIAAILDGVAPGKFRRRVIARKVLSTGNVEQDYKKDGQAYWPVTLTTHYVSSSITPIHVVDQTS